MPLTITLMTINLTCPSKYPKITRFNIQMIRNSNSCFVCHCLQHKHIVPRRNLGSELGESYFSEKEIARLIEYIYFYSMVLSL